MPYRRATHCASTSHSSSFCPKLHFGLGDSWQQALAGSLSDLRSFDCPAGSFRSRRLLTSDAVALLTQALLARTGRRLEINAIILRYVLSAFSHAAIARLLDWWTNLLCFRAGTDGIFCFAYNSSRWQCCRTRARKATLDRHFFWNCFSGQFATLQPPY